jgi:hypothetical protein
VIVEALGYIRVARRKQSAPQIEGASRKLPGLFVLAKIQISNTQIVESRSSIEVIAQGSAPDRKRSMEQVARLYVFAGMEAQDTETVDRSRDRRVMSAMHCLAEGKRLTENLLGSFHTRQVHQKDTKVVEDTGLHLGLPIAVQDSQGIAEVLLGAREFSQAETGRREIVRRNRGGGMIWSEFFHRSGSGAQKYRDRLSAESPLAEAVALIIEWNPQLGCCAGSERRIGLCVCARPRQEHNGANISC